MLMNAELKYRARTALKNNWQVALMVALIASLPSLLVQVVGIMSSTDLTMMMNQLAMEISAANTVAEVQRLTDQMLAALGATWPVRLLELVAFLVAPCLTLGMLNYLLGLLRGNQEQGIDTVSPAWGSSGRALACS